MQCNKINRIQNHRNNWKSVKLQFICAWNDKLLKKEKKKKKKQATEYNHSIILYASHSRKILQYHFGTYWKKNFDHWMKMVQSGPSNWLMYFKKILKIYKKIKAGCRSPDFPLLSCLILSKDKNLSDGYYTWRLFLERWAISLIDITTFLGI